MNKFYLFLNVIFILNNIHLIYTCMSMGDSGGGEVTTTTSTTTTTTTTTAMECEEMEGQVLMFQQSDNEFQPEVWGAVPASSNCMECADGADRYWPTASSATPTEALQEAAGSLNTNNCPDLCACDAAGTCYTWTGVDPDVALTFWPFCSGGSCLMYGVITTTSDAAGVTAVGGGETFTGGGQLTVQNGQIVRQPVTEPVYPQVRSVGCSGCNGNPRTCVA